MSYEYITKYDSPNYTAGRQGNKISEIVIHHWGADGQSFNTVVNWLCRANGNSSAHYIVEANKVACIVDCANTAWHAGNFAHNLKSIGIECRPEMSAGDLETVCELVADIYKVYGVLPIIGHKDVSATACPGRYYAKLAYIKQRAQEIMNGSKPSTGGSTNTSDGSYESYNGYVEVIYDGLTIRKSASWDASAAAGTVKKGEVFTVVGRQLVGGVYLYKLKSGYWITSAPEYVSYRTTLHGSSTSTKKSIDTIAREVIAGQWGNGADRKNRLTAAGYDYNAVQKRVNELM